MGRAPTMSMVTPAVSSLDEDHELVASVRAGDDRAFELLYERYRPRITAFVQGYVKDHARAEDVTQEVFFSAVRRMRATDRPIAFRAWIYEIARNACIDQFRRSSSRAQELSFDEDEGLAPGDRTRLVAPAGAPEDAADGAERLNDLYGALGDLSESHHRILVLRELEGRSYQEIGERMGMTKAGVESTLFRARKRLGEQYDDITTGRRCVRVRTAVALAAEAGDGLRTRDQRSVGRHLSHCASCRVFMRRAGVEVEVPDRSWLAERLRILLPIPAFLRRGPGGHRGELAARVGTALGPQADPLGNGAAKIATAAAALAVAVLGAGVASHPGAGPGRPADGSAAAAAPATTLLPAAPGGFTASGGGRVAVQPGRAGGAGSSVPGARRPSGSAKGGSPSSRSRKRAADKGAGGGSSGGGSSSGSGGERGSGGSGASDRSSPGGGAGEAVRRTGKEVAGSVQNAGQGAGGAVKDTGQSVGGAVQQTGQSVGQTVGGVSPAAGNTVSGTTQTAGGAVSGATGAAGGAVSGATGTTGGAVSGATGAAGGAVGGLTGGG